MDSRSNYTFKMKFIVIENKILVVKNKYTIFFDNKTYIFIGGNI